MVTVTGRLEDSEGRVLHRQIVFESRSTPTDQGSGLLTGNSTLKLDTDPSTGEFSIDLRPGAYAVTYQTRPRQTQFNIEIPVEDEGTTVAIDELIVDTFAALPGVAPYTVWNGVRAGHITFNPIDDAPQPGASEVAFTGGHITSENYWYVITYVTPEGETEGDPGGIGVQGITGSGAANKAIRVTMAANPPRATAKRIWRNAVTAGLPTQQPMYLLAEVAPGTTAYDDFESHANFNARKDAATHPPAFNTTAGIIYAKAGSAVLYFSQSGLKTLTTLTLGSDLIIPTGAANGNVLTSDANGSANWQSPITLVGIQGAQANYGGVAPSWTPVSGFGVAADNSTGRIWWYYGGQWN